MKNTLRKTNDYEKAKQANIKRSPATGIEETELNRRRSGAVMIFMSERIARV